MSDADWPPRFTMTPEGAIRIILGNYDAEQNAAKTELALLELLRQAQQSGIEHGLKLAAKRTDDVRAKQ